MVKRYKETKQASLIFNLPSEEDDYEIASKYAEMYKSIDEFLCYLYAKGKFDSAQKEFLEEMQDKFGDILEKNGLSKYI